MLFFLSPEWTETMSSATQCRQPPVEARNSRTCAMERKTRPCGETKYLSVLTPVCTPPVARVRMSFLKAVLISRPGCRFWGECEALEE